MILVTLQDKSIVYINPDHIERIEDKKYNTVITLANEKKLVVVDEIDEILNRIMTFRKEVGFRLPLVTKDE